MLTAELTVEDAIHRRWALDPRLCAIVPPERLTTGPAQGEQTALDDDGLAQAPLPPLPNAQITRTANTAGFRSTSGRGDSSAIRIQAWVNQYAQGVNLTKGVRRLFDNVDWSEPGIKITCCRVENDYPLMEDDGVWQFVIDLQIESQPR